MKLKFLFFTFCNGEYYNRCGTSESYQDRFKSLSFQVKTIHLRKFKIKNQKKGRVNTTRRGFSCQHWQTNSPHEVKIKPLNADHNYCRNPDGDPRGPWCYTTSEIKWDYCFIPVCECVHTCLPDKSRFNQIAPDVGVKSRRRAH